MRSRLSFIAISAFILAAPSAAPAIAQTDIALSLYGAFSKAESGNGVIQSPANSAGGMFEFRHIKNPLLGFEGTYSFNRADQKYSSALAITCPINPPTPCPPPAARIAADAHEVTADWVPSLKVLNLRPFAVLGGGLIFHQPTGDQPGTKSSTQGVFVYGAGLDIALIPHFGVRFQYRGNLYQAPDLTELFTSAKKFTHTAEPMGGVYIRF